MLAFGTRSETKNVNSLRSVERAVRYEVGRHAAVLSSGGTIVQETRHWHEDTGVTTSGRAKSDADDYRYFPEPDLVPVAPSRELVESLRATLDLDPVDRAVVELDVEVALERDRLVVLRGLEVLRHVRVEVVLAGEPAPLRDLAVEHEPDADRRLHGHRVDDRQGTGQTQTHRAGLGVGLGAELGRAAAEHLRRGVQLDVHLESHDGVERGDRVVEGKGRLGVGLGHGSGFRSCVASGKVAVLGPG